MNYEFKSAITRGGGILTPDHIIIENNNVIWKRRNKYLIGYDSISIPIDKISSIELDDKYWGVDITITGYGGKSIFAKSFTGADAKKIKEILSNK